MYYTIINFAHNYINKFVTSLIKKTSIFILILKSWIPCRDG